MSLSRWSNSCWYIYQTERRRLEICGYGRFGVAEVLRDFPRINREAKESGYTLLERLELRVYLQSWALWKMKKLDYDTYSKILGLTRFWGEIKQYLKDPWTPFGLPKGRDLQWAFKKRRTDWSRK